MDSLAGISIRSLAQPLDSSMCQTSPMKHTNPMNFILHWSSCKTVMITMLTASTRMGSDKHAIVQSSRRGLGLQCIMVLTCELKTPVRGPKGEAFAHCGYLRRVTGSNNSSSTSVEMPNEFHFFYIVRK